MFLGKSLRALAGVLFWLPSAALGQGAFELTVRGATCKQDVGGTVSCRYVVGEDLEFSIAAVGTTNAGISFLRSSIRGDYFARYGIQHGCVIVEHGERSVAKSLAASWAFISPKNGRVYRTWQECQESKV